MDNQATDAIVAWAEKRAAPKNAPDRSRLTQAEIALLFQLHRDGLTQPQIAQRLGCNQPTVSKWLKTLTDTTGVAKEYLRGSALSMAQNIVKNGRAADHVAALKGLSVLHEESHAGVTVVVGGGSDVKIGVVQPLQVVVDALPGQAHTETPAKSAVSDKADYVNQLTDEDSTG